MLGVKYHPSAEQEIVNQGQYYQSIWPNLGYEFLDEVDRAIQFIRENPNSCRVVKSKYRRYPLSQFPFIIYFRVLSGTIFIYAVANCYRREFYWLGRKE